MQCEAIARALRQHLVPERYAILSGAARLCVSAETLERLHHPCAGLHVAGPHVEVGQLTRTEVRGNAHRLALAAYGLNIALRSRLLVADADQHLGVGTLHGYRGMRRCDQRPQQFRGALRHCRTPWVVTVIHDLGLHQVGKSQTSYGGLGMIAVLLQLGKQLLGLGGISAGAIELPQRAPCARAIHHGHRRVPHRLGAPGRAGRAWK